MKKSRTATEQDAGSSEPVVSPKTERKAAGKTAAPGETAAADQSTVDRKSERLSRKLDAARAEESKRRSQLEAAQTSGKKIGKRTKQLGAATALVAALTSRIEGLRGRALGGRPATDQLTQSTDGHGSARAVASGPTTHPPTKAASTGSRPARTASSASPGAKRVSARPAGARRTSPARTGQGSATRSTPPRRSLRKRDRSGPPANDG